MDASRKRRSASSANAGTLSQPRCVPGLSRALERIYPFLSVEAGGRVPVEVTTRCNQRCPFCQAVDPRPDSDPECSALAAGVERCCMALPGARVILTGGEPTLRDDLVALVERLLGVSGLDVLEVQTNAVRIGRHPERFGFPSHPNLRFLVALHAVEPETYAACVGARGQLDAALQGIRVLMGQGQQVELNCVVTTLNIHNLESILQALVERMPDRTVPPVHYTIMGIPEHRRAEHLLVTYSELLARLEAASRRAAELGLRTRMALSAGHAAVPACMLARSALGQSLPQPRYEHEGCTGADARSNWWVQGEACRDCVLAERCPGLPRS